MKNNNGYFGVTALVSAIVFVLSGVSSADLIEPNLPERHEVKRKPKAESTPPVGLTNPDLPNRKGVDVEYFKVHAAARVAEQFDSNVFLADSDTESDFITILAPSVGVEKKLGDSLFSADYEMAQYLFGTWHSQNHLDHNLRGLLETQWTDYKITLSDNFRIFTDRASNEDSLRLKEDTNNFKAGVSAQFDQFGFDTGYIQKLQVYDSNDLYVGSLTYNEKSYMDQSVYGTLSYRFWPKTYFIFENDLGYINYYKTSELPDSYYVDSLVGLRGEWTSKITLNLRVGFRYQHYDYSDVVAHKPYVGGIVRGGLEYNPTEDDKVILNLERTDIESTYSTNNYYTLNLAGLDYKHKFSDKLSGGLFGVYQFHQYPSQTTENGETAKRYDNLLNAGASVRYDMNRWFSTELKYEYRYKASKFDIFDFNDNLVTLRGTVGF
jgi:hypothetical protein